MKSFIKWCNSTSESTETTDLLQDRLLAQLAQVEFAMKKSNLSSTMMKGELKNYEKISEQIGSGIELVKQQIDQNKENLVVAKKIRKNRMEYDALAKIITQQPDRQETVAKLNNLKDELNELETTTVSLEKKLEKRRKDFTVLMRAVMELQGDREFSGSEDEGEADDDDDKEMEADTSSDEDGIVEVPIN